MSSHWPDESDRAPRDITAQSSASKKERDAGRGVRYTCFIRLPFPRNGFEDPPVVRWDAARDKALWKLIYKNPSSKDLNWQAIADNFDVSLAFLLQQAAWLSERHLEGMRKQMQRLGGSVAAGPASSGQELPNRSGSGASSNIAKAAAKNTTPRPSSLTFKTSPSFQGDSTDVPGTPGSAKPTLSRTPSTTTVTQSRISVLGSRAPIQRTFRDSTASSKRRLSLNDPLESSADASVSADTSSRDSESGEERTTAERSNFSRTILPRQDTSSFDATRDDDEDSPGGYLPFAASSRSSKPDGTPATRRTTRKQTVPSATISKGDVVMSSPSAGSSETSATAATAAERAPADKRATKQRLGPLSPQQRAQLASLSPRYRREASEDSPSMGSSFSDLESSVTQSALEEALMSMQQHGSPSTRMSALGNVLKRMQ